MYLFDLGEGYNGFMKQIKCPNCQSVVDGEKKFCPDCGQPLETIEESVNTNEVPDWVKKWEKKPKTCGFVLGIAALVAVVFAVIFFVLTSVDKEVTVFKYDYSFSSPFLNSGNREDEVYYSDKLIYVIPAILFSVVGFTFLMLAAATFFFLVDYQEFSGHTVLVYSGFFGHTFVIDGEVVCHNYFGGYLEGYLPDGQYVWAVVYRNIWRPTSVIGIGTDNIGIRK